MQSHTDINDMAKEVGQQEPILRRDELSFTQGPINLHAGTLIVSGDAGPGSVVRGQGNVVINGSLVGNPHRPIDIEVDGDVVVRGSALHALLDARWIYVGDEALNVQVNARWGFDLGGDLGDARVRVGEYDLERKRIDHMKTRLANALWGRDATERKLRMEEKRVDKMFKNTRIALAPNVGHILQARRHRLVVNLAPIYESLAGRQEQEIDNALREFFAKAIVGLLTRTNQHFITSKNRHRQEIFKDILRQVHALFFLTRTFDKKTQQCEILDRQVDEAIRALDGRLAQITVRGKCQPELSVSIVVPEVVVSNDGSVMVSGDTARMQVTRAPEGRLDVTCVNALGMKTSLVQDANVLQSCQILLADGEVVWPAIGACEVAEV